MLRFAGNDDRKDTRLPEEDYQGIMTGYIIVSVDALATCSLTDRCCYRNTTAPYYLNPRKLHDTELFIKLSAWPWGGCMSTSTL
jgi:hypothetical protein